MKRPKLVPRSYRNNIYDSKENKEIQLTCGGLLAIGPVRDLVWDSL